MGSCDGWERAGAFESGTWGERGLQIAGLVTFREDAWLWWGVNSGYFLIKL